MKKKSQTKYGLYHPKYKKLLGFAVIGNDSMEFSGSVEHELCPFSNNIWLVSDRKKAEKAAKTNVSWYNDEYETPSNSYTNDMLVVVAVNLSYSI